MHYLKYYEEITSKQVPKGFEVHHIDINRENNHISNLVAIPIKLHRKYHQHQRDFTRHFGVDGIENIISIKPNMSNVGIGFYFEIFEKFYESHSEICKWLFLIENLIHGSANFFGCKYE